MGGQNRKSWSRDTRGGTLMMFALFMPVVFLLVGGAIDFSRMLQLRSALQDAADAASVGAVGLNSDAYKAGVAMTGDGAIPAGATQAQQIFNTDMATHTDLTGVVFNAAVAKSGTDINSTVSVNATYKSAILGLFNTSFVSFPIAITSKSSATVPPYIDFYLLLDNTPSMGLGATTADIAKLQANTPVSVYGNVNGDNKSNCAFACHESDMPSSGTGEDLYDLAKDLKVTMRIDVVRQATQQLMTTAASTETLPNQYSMAIYDFGTSANAIPQSSPPAYQISALTSNLTASASNASAIDLMTISKQNYNSDEQSNMVSVLADMNTRIPANGSGLSSTATQKVLFMVSDGMNDGHDCAYSDGGTSCRRIRPIDTATCTTLKNRGVRIAVLYTTYYPPGGSWFDTYVKPLVSPTDTLAPAMQSCASPGLFFAVSPDEDMSVAMDALFRKVVSVVKIDS